MVATNELSIVEFSDGVRTRANSMQTVQGFPHRYTCVLDAIERSGWMLDLANDLLSYSGKEQNRQDAIAAEQVLQSHLQKYSIVGDESAIAFMNSIAPQLYRWERQLKEIRQRHSSELEIFKQLLMNGLT